MATIVIYLMHSFCEKIKSKGDKMQSINLNEARWTSVVMQSNERMAL